MDSKVETVRGTYLFWAFMLLVLPCRWVSGALAAAAVHEMAHILLLWIVKGQILRITIHPMGAEIRTMELSRGKEAVCAIAGPAGSLALAVLVKQVFPEMAICAMVQGIFNLLPVYPLDGGRVIRCFVSEATSKAVQVLTVILLWGMGIWAGLRWNLGISALFPALAATRVAILRKTPCKEPKLAVQ